MLILVLIDVQYLQNVVFCFEKGSNGQNHSSSDSQLTLPSPTPLEYGQNLVKLLYSNSFVAIKISSRYDCFNKDSGCLHQFTVLG